MELSREELVDRVVDRTQGTASDPLSRDEVEQVVDATLLELNRPAAETPEPEPVSPESPGVREPDAPREEQAGEPPTRY